MTTPISNKGPAKALPLSQSPAATALTSFTRRQSQTTTLPIVGVGQKQSPTVVAMTGTRTLNDAQLHAIGAEIVRLFNQKVICNNRRQMDFTVEGEKYSIRGVNPEKVLLHTPDGSILFQPDGMPMRNVTGPVGSWKQAELGLTSALAELRKAR